MRQTEIITQRVHAPPLTALGERQQRESERLIRTLSQASVGRPVSPRALQRLLRGLRRARVAQEIGQ